MTDLDESIGQVLRNCQADFGILVSGWNDSTLLLVMVEIILYGDQELNLWAGWLFCLKDSEDEASRKFAGD
jgi:hypothetical protein